MTEEQVHEIHQGFGDEEEQMDVVHELGDHEPLVMDEGHEDDQMDMLSPDKKKLARRRRRTAYAYFCADNRKQVLEENPDLSFGGCSQKLSDLWRRMPAAEKAPYEERAEEYAKAYPDPMDASMGASGDETPKRRGRKRRERKWTKDPSAPKKALTPYIVFGKAIRDEVTAFLKEQNPNTKPTEIMKEISARWTKLTAAEKAPYELDANKDRERYEEEKKRWEAENPGLKTPSVKKPKRLVEESERRVLKIRVRGQQDEVFDKVFIDTPFNMKALHKKIQSKLENYSPIVEIIHLPDHRVRDQDDLDSLANEATLEVVFDPSAMEVMPEA